MDKKIKEVKKNIDKVSELLYKTAKIMATNQEINWENIFSYSYDDISCINKIYHYHDIIMDIRIMSGISKSKISKKEIIKKYTEK